MPCGIQLKIWELQLKFYKQMLDSRISVPANKLYDQSKWFMDGINVRTEDRVTPVMFMNPVTRTAIQPFVGSTLSVRSGGVQQEDGVGVNIAAVAIALPPDTLWEVVGIAATAQCAIAIANRNIHVEALNLPSRLPALPAGMNTIETSAILLTAGQFGGIFLDTGPNHWTNVNGALAAVAGENPLPKEFNAPSAISIQSDNPQIDDEIAIEVWYKNVVI